MAAKKRSRSSAAPTARRQSAGKVPTPPSYALSAAARLPQHQVRDADAAVYDWRAAMPEAIVRDSSYHRSRQSGGSGQTGDPSAAQATQPQWLRFPIVGVAASGGGIEAFSQMLAALPADTGIAIVFMHLSTHGDRLLAELLSSQAHVPVVQIADGMKIEPDHVYITPPNAQVDIEDGILSLQTRPNDASQHMPADDFFSSLAQAAQSRAIGVVLSGTAADGATGIRQIKTVGGITMAQDPGTAKFDGMPRAAVATGVVDLVLPPRELALELARISHHPFLRPQSPDDTDGSEEQLPRIFTMLRNAGGVDFSHYKLPTIQRRLQRRMVLHRITSMDAYVNYLQEHPNEVDALYRDLLIQVTRFFREPESFKALSELAFPAILANRRSSDDPVRIWVPGCATGEEPYSVAIALLETLGDRALGVPVQIFATDICEVAIEHARSGIYPQSIAADVSAERLRRFFERVVDGNYRINKTVRDLCVFTRQDLTRDPPFSRLDLIVCRNVLIYLSTALQMRLMTEFHYALKPNSYLMLGAAETVGPTGLFTLVDKRHRLYAKRSAAVHASLPLAPLSPGSPAELASQASSLPSATVQKEADRIAAGQASLQPVQTGPAAAQVVYDTGADRRQGTGRRTGSAGRLPGAHQPAIVTSDRGPTHTDVAASRPADRAAEPEPSEKPGEARVNRLGQDRYGRLSKTELILRLQAFEQSHDLPADYLLLKELAVHQEEVRAQNQQLLEMQRHLEVSRDSYADLYDFAPVAYASLDGNGAIRAVNMTGAKLLGLERAELLGKPLGAFVEQQDLPRFQDHLLQCRREHEASAEIRMRSRDGRSFPAHLTTHLLRLSVEPADLSYRTAITDLTEHRRVEEERQSALLREGAARAASETKDRLIAMVSHELRTPLSAVLLWAKILQIKLADQAEAAHALEVIVRSAEAQRQLIDDLLDISRITSGKLRLELKHVPLAPLVATTLESVLPAARAKGICIETDISPEIGMVRLDPDRLRQVLWNLLNNAVKFTPDGGQVRLSAQRIGAQLDVRVSDTGQGIEANLLPHIFEPFRQAESSITTRAHGGLGLGLAISKQLVEQHGGTIHVLSEGAGRGATFVVRLPLIATRAEANDIAGVSFAQAVKAPDPGALAGLQVLLVEDEIATRSALETLLGAAGARLTAVGTAQAAIEAFQRMRPDIILGDIGMPGVDGYQMMQQLRGLEQASGMAPTPAIALTAFAGSNDRERARAAGFNLHLAKPVEPAELVTTLQRLARSAAAGAPPAPPASA